MRLLPRLCFVLFATCALASVLGGTGCTRRGTVSVIPSGPPGARTLYVSAAAGSDSNSGSQTAPFKTVTKAFRIAASPGPIAVSAVNILAGDYNTANGEKFPLLVPSGVTITGSNYGRGASRGTFIDGAGEDTTYEKLVNAPAGSYYAAMLVGVSATGVSMTGLYVGASKPGLPSAAAVYDSVDDLGNMSAATTSFDAPPPAGVPHSNGVLVPGGSFTCTSCAVGGNTWGIAAFSVSVPLTSPSPSSTPIASGTPSVTLTGPATQGNGQIGGRVYGIYTDGSVAVTVSNQTFSAGGYAFADNLAARQTGLTPVPADFGQGAGSPQSTGNNVFIGAKTSEIFLTVPNDNAAAFGDTWNPNTQDTNLHGQYTANRSFGPGESGRNATVSTTATGAKIFVGPFAQPTPTPSASPSPSGSPSSSPSPTSSP